MYASCIRGRSACHQQIPPSASRSRARSRGSSCDQGVASIASSRRRASARWPCFCQNRHIEKASGIATSGSGRATARSSAARMSSWAISSRSSQRRCSSPDSWDAACSASATNQSRCRSRTASRSPLASSCSAANSRIDSSMAEARLAVGRLVDPDEALVGERRSGRRRHRPRARTPDRAPLRRRRCRPTPRRPTAGRAGGGCRRRGGHSSRRWRRAGSAGGRAGRAPPEASTSS